MRIGLIVLLLVAVLGGRWILSQVDTSAPAVAERAAIKVPMALAEQPASSVPREALQLADETERGWADYKAGHAEEPPPPENVECLERASAALKPGDAVDFAARVQRIRAQEPAMEKARRAVDRARTAKMEKENLERRRTYATTVEKGFLGKGMDVYVSVQGKGYRVLRLKYVLMSRPLVYQISHNENVISAWRDVGFEKVIFTDGYNETWTVTLR